jgi:serine/threonine-protein kinase HipA
LAPFYDVTFSPSPYGEHATTFTGFGKKPPLKAIQQLATQASYANWKQAQSVIAEVVEAISHFAVLARQLGVAEDTVRLIGKQLDKVYQDNKTLL